MTVKKLALAWTCLLLAIPSNADIIYVKQSGKDRTNLNILLIKADLLLGIFSAPAAGDIIYLNTDGSGLVCIDGGMKLQKNTLSSRYNPDCLRIIG